MKKLHGNKGKFEYDKNPMWKDGIGACRRLAFEKYGMDKKCEKCGTDEGQIDVHHRNKNRHDNSRVNLRPLCINCHLRHHQLGRKHSEKTRNKISKSQKGRVFSKETIEKMKMSSAIRFQNPIERNRIAISTGDQSGKNNPMYGKRHSPDAMLKMILSRTLYYKRKQIYQLVNNN